MDARPSLDAAFTAFGLPAMLAPPGEGGLLPPDAAVAVTGVWHQGPSVASPPGMEVTAIEPRNRLAFRRREVPTLKRGTLVWISEYRGAPVKKWRVDIVEESNSEEVRVLMLPVDNA